MTDKLHLCAVCGNEGVKISMTKDRNYVLRCKFCNRKKYIKEDHWQGIKQEVAIFDCEPIRPR